MTKVLNSVKLVPVLFVLDVAVMYASLTLSGLTLNVQNICFPFTYYLRNFYTELNYFFFLNVFHFVVLSKELPSLLTLITV